jgi:hypothetical protein
MNVPRGTCQRGVVITKHRYRDRRPHRESNDQRDHLRCHLRGETGPRPAQPVVGRLGADAARRLPLRSTDRVGASRVPEHPVGRLPGPVAGRQVPPRRPGGDPPPDPVHHRRCRARGRPRPRRGRQHPLQASPLLITQVTTAHARIIPALQHQDPLMRHGLGQACGERYRQITLRSRVRRSVLVAANRQLRTCPSAVSRTRSQVPQNGRVTEPITPTRAGPPSTRNVSAGPIRGCPGRRASG